MRTRCIWIVVLFAGIAFLVYGRSVLVNEFVALDDDILITQNAAVQEISSASVKFIFTTFDPELYIPFTFLSYQLDYALWGLNPIGFHLMNLLLHVANAVLVYLIVQRLFDRTYQPHPSVGADRTRGRVRLEMLVALLFLLHPIQTEAVAWAAARKDLLSAFFTLLTILLYLRGKHAWGVTTFILALLSKVSVVTLPLVFLFFPAGRGQDLSRPRPTLKVLTPYLILSFLFGGIALLGKQTTLSLTSLPDAILIAARGTMFYIQKLIAPLDLSVLYPVEGDVTITNPIYLLPFVGVLGFLGILVVSFRREWRSVTFGLAFFLLMLAPSFTNIAKGGDLYFASDRYVYLASLGVFVLVAQGLRFLSPRIATGVTLITLLTLSVFAFKQSLIWQDTETLFTNVLTHYPSSHLAHNKVGAVLFERGKVEEAVTHFHTSLALKENPRAYFNLGVVEISQGDYVNARRLNEKAIAIDPLYAPAYENMGFLYYREGRIDEAVAAFQRAIDLSPLSHTARENLRAIQEAQNDGT